MLVIPGRYSSQDVKFNGAFVFYIDKDEVILRGIVDHYTPPNDNFHQRTVQRSLYIEDFLYTKSLCLLKINLIEDLHGVKNIKIPCQKTQVFRPKPQPFHPFLGPIIRNSQWLKSIIF